MNEAMQMNTLFGATLVPERRYTNIHNSEWTQERFELLKELYNLGSTAWIAREINRQTGSTFTRNAVIGKIGRTGLIRSVEPRVWHSLCGRPRTRVTSPTQKRTYQRKTPAPKTLFDDTAAPSEFLGVSFDDLKSDQCRYPRGEGQDLKFCGQPKMKKSSYCASCYRICYVPTVERVKEKR